MRLHSSRWKSALLLKQTFDLYQNNVVRNPNEAASHKVIDMYIKKNGEDLRYQVSPHPEKVLQDRTYDNTSVGRIDAE